MGLKPSPDSKNNGHNLRTHSDGVRPYLYLYRKLLSVLFIFLVLALLWRCFSSKNIIVHAVPKFTQPKIKLPNRSMIPE
jgi:hypothetical protein